MSEEDTKTGEVEFMNLSTPGNVRHADKQGYITPTKSPEPAVYNLVALFTEGTSYAGNAHKHTQYRRTRYAKGVGSRL